MKISIVEIKAVCHDPDRVRKILLDHNARFVGQDHQIDTYFVVETGRLKLREGDIENSLIYYNRPDDAGPKRSDVQLYKTQKESGLKDVLMSFLDEFVVVDKHREIYFIDNVKFHIDRVEGLGSFVEIEAIDNDGSIGEESLRRQCDHFLEMLAIPESDLLTDSYSDMLAVSAH
ncbi:MAG: class IV adenylate cyclase [Bacteroidetes bacterium]|nr:class IV adenylate cyclase [Bacteroidota bacterium]